MSFCVAAATDGTTSAKQVVSAEPVARGPDLVDDGRHQSVAVVPRGRDAGLDALLHPFAKAPFGCRYCYLACCLLADRSGGVGIRRRAYPAMGLETSLVCRLAGGAADSCLRLAVAPMAAGAGDDGTDLLPHPVALSAVERLR